jgi:hypothetical protein
MRHLILWALTIVVAAVSLLAGTQKLVGALLEVAGAPGLFIAAAARFAALSLAAVMIGAIVTQLFVIGGSPLLLIAQLAMAVAIAYLRRRQISSRIAIA